MKLATWNVNSLKVRLPHVLEFLDRHKPDALCLQELKLEDANFPLAAINAAGYQAVYSGQKTYNGVAILSPTAAADVSAGIPGLEDPQRRVIAATVNGVRVVCVYIPNGEAVESEKYKYKLDWLQALTAVVETGSGGLSQTRAVGRLQYRAGGPRCLRSQGLGWKSVV